MTALQEARAAHARTNQTDDPDDKAYFKATSLSALAQAEALESICDLLEATNYQLADIANAIGSTNNQLANITANIDWAIKALAQSITAPGK